MVARRYSVLLVALLYSCAHSTENSEILIGNSIEGCFGVISARISSIEDPVIADVLIGPKNKAQVCPCKSALTKYSVYQVKGEEISSLLTGYFSIIDTEKVVLPIAVQARQIYRDTPINVDLSCSGV